MKFGYDYSNEKVPHECLKSSNIGLIIRMLLSILFFVYTQTEFGKKLDNITSSLILVALDLSDNFNTKEKCRSTFRSIFIDQVIDNIVYWLAYLLLPLGEIIKKQFFYFTALHTIRVIMFGSTKHSKWLIIFPDLVTEFLLYSFISEKYGPKPYLIPILFLGKIGLIYYHFSYMILRNKKEYTKKDKVLNNIERFIKKYYMLISAS